jgi:hypothetical protein
MADRRRQALGFARSKPAGDMLGFNVSKVASSSPAGAPAVGHKRS